MNSFVVSNGLTTKNGSLKFVIEHMDRIPPTLLSNKGLQLLEGAMVIITSEVLELTDPDTVVGNLTYSITQQPRHGRLFLKGKALPMGRFTQADVNDLDLTYQHNGGQAEIDQFTFTASDGTNEGFLLYGQLRKEPVVFTIQVDHIDKSSPCIVTKGRPSTVEGLKDGRFVIYITARSLKAMDQDSKDDELDFTILRPPYSGYLENAITGEYVKGRFTQRDLNLRSIRYVINPSIEVTGDSFEFRVSDPAGNAMLPEVMELTWSRIELAAQCFRVCENVGTLSIQVVRSGNSEDPSYIGIQVQEDSAKVGRDFTHSSASLIQFDPGVSTKMWNIFLKDDGLEENNEKFKIQLRVPKNAILGQKDKASVEIIDPRGGSCDPEELRPDGNVEMSFISAVDRPSNGGSSVSHPEKGSSSKREEPWERYASPPRGDVPQTDHYSGGVVQEEVPRPQTRKHLQVVGSSRRVRPSGVERKNEETVWTVAYRSQNVVKSVTGLLWFLELEKAETEQKAGGAQVSTEVHSDSHTVAMRRRAQGLQKAGGAQVSTEVHCDSHTVAMRRRAQGLQKAGGAQVSTEVHCDSHTVAMRRRAQGLQKAGGAQVSTEVHCDSHTVAMRRRAQGLQKAGGAQVSTEVHCDSHTVAMRRRAQGLQKAGGAQVSTEVHCDSHTVAMRRRAQGLQKAGGAQVSTEVHCDSHTVAMRRRAQGLQKAGGAQVSTEVHCDSHTVAMRRRAQGLQKAGGAQVSTEVHCDSHTVAMRRRAQGLQKAGGAQVSTEVHCDSHTVAMRRRAQGLQKAGGAQVSTEVHCDSHTVAMRRRAQGLQKAGGAQVSTEVHCDSHTVAMRRRAQGLQKAGGAQVSTEVHCDSHTVAMRRRAQGLQKAGGAQVSTEVHCDSHTVAMRRRAQGLQKAGGAQVSTEVHCDSHTVAMRRRAQGLQKAGGAQVSTEVHCDSHTVAMRRRAQGLQKAGGAQVSTEVHCDSHTVAMRRRAQGLQKAGGAQVSTEVHCDSHTVAMRRRAQGLQKAGGAQFHGIIPLRVEEKRVAVPVQPSSFQTDLHIPHSWSWQPSSLHLNRGGEIPQGDSPPVYISAPAILSTSVDNSSCPPGWTLHGKHCYSLSPSYLATWERAEKDCRLMFQSHLVSVHSEKEIKWLWKFAGKLPFWIAINEQTLLIAP
ncbi:UNVERIFIED_CONTAM: hypothetical protein FKN15_035473 [Acipenser sinensis]